VSSHRSITETALIDDPSTADDALTRCLSVRQLAAYWRCSPARVRKLVRRGVLRAFLVGRAVRIPPDAVREAERILAAPVTCGRRKRPGHRGILWEIAELLDGAG
jgi:excisionase family DNA binding protein